MNNELTFDDLETHINAENIIQLVGLKLGEEEYAIDVLKIQEIIRTVEITIVPRAENYVLGVMNLRGKVIPVVDLRIRFNLDKVDFDNATRIIVVRFEKEHIGFVVDEVTQVINITKDMVEPTPPLVGIIGQEYILGICKYDEKLIILLDIDSIAGLASSGESALRQKFKVDNISVKSLDFNIGKENAESNKVPNAYSMADEVDASFKPIITSIPDEQSILDDVSKQNKLQDSVTEAIVQEELDRLIFQELAKFESETDELSKDSEIDEPHDTDDIDDLIAQELAKREAETEEFNKKKKAEEVHSADDIDELIAQELAKREAETEEFNKKKKAEEVHSADDIDELIAQELAKREADTEEFNKKKESVEAHETEDIDDLIAQELAKREAETEEFNKKKESVEAHETEDIDDLIAQELAKREAETEEYNKKKKAEEAHEIDDIDDLIAQELAKREAETEEYNKIRKRQKNEPDSVSDILLNLEEDDNDTFDSLDDLKEAANKIISGSSEDIDTAVKSEVGELLAIIIDIKAKIDEISPNLIMSQKDLPKVTHALSNVNAATEKAAFNVLTSAQRMEEFYRDLQDEVKELNRLIDAQDTEGFEMLKEQIEINVKSAEDLGMDILQALEFQDITEQQIRKILKSMEEVGARLGSMIGFMRSSNIGKLAEYNELLADLGFA